MSIIGLPDEILSIINEFCPFDNLLQTCSILHQVTRRIVMPRLLRPIRRKQRQTDGGGPLRGCVFGPVRNMG